MKKNFLTVIAVMVTAFLVGTSIAQAVSVEWGGQLRPRFEYDEQTLFNDSSGIGTANQGTRDGDFFVSSRIRLHAKADILPDTSAFIQLQSVRNWGNDLDLTGGAGANLPTTTGAGKGLGGAGGLGAGSGSAAFTPSDNDNSVGIHQAYFTLKNFATLPADLKVGRQEVVIDGHRIFGNTGWTQGAQTHDAARVTHAAGNHTLSYVYSLGNEGERLAAGSSFNDNEDIEIHLIYANMQGILGGGLSLYFVALDDDCSLGAGGCANTTAAGIGNTGTTVIENNNYTIGARQAGQLFGIDYRAEFYYQFGDAEGDSLLIAAPYTRTGGGSDVDRQAYMFGARVGKKFNNVMWKPSITFWYDYLSGTSDEDARDGDFQTFNTLFDTGHKFYGFMDLFLSNTGANTGFLGLVDYAVKASVQPAKGWTFKSHWHYFTTAEGIQSNPGISPGAVVVTGSDDDFLGHELDLTLVHKYNANTTISAGWSQFWQESSFEVLNAAASPTATVTPAQWAYVMFDVKF